jgi:hypothetical protein
MAADQEVVQRFASGKAASIDCTVVNPGSSVWVGQQFRSNSAHSKILIMLLAFNGPVDLLTGQKIDVSKALYQGNSKEFHHFFPRDYLLKSSKATPRRANLLANIVMLTAASNKVITNRAPADYLGGSLDRLGDGFDAALEANLVSREAFEAALAADYDAFLEARAKAIHAAVSKLTGW